MLSLNFIKREQKNTEAGMLKCIVYGKGKENLSIFVNFIDFIKVLSKEKETGVVTLVGENEKIDVLIKDVSYDPVKNIPVHVDFYILEKGKKINTKVPLEFVGVSEGLKTSGGSLVKVAHDINIEAESHNIPKNILVDLSLLSTVHSVISVKDLSLPEGVNLHHVNPSDIVASISMQEEESSANQNIDLSSIQVSEKGKKEASEK